MAGSLVILERELVRRSERRERERLELLEKLRAVLQRRLPGAAVWVYGSVVRPGKFREPSDVDLALEAEPEGGVLRLMSHLAEDVGRPVDVCLLEETRLKAKIVREGLRWMP